MTDRELAKLHCEMRNMLNEVEYKLSQFYDNKNQLLNERGDLTENALCEEVIHVEERLDAIEQAIEEIKEAIS